MHALAGRNQVASEGLGLLEELLIAAKNAKVGLKKSRLDDIRFKEKTVVVFSLSR